MLYLSNQRYRNEFNEACTLGKGGFGTVFRSTNKLDGHDYAIKKIRLSSAARWSQQLEKVLREIIPILSDIIKLGWKGWHPKTCSQRL
ncbi:eukaryotic translation initiation factor 2-alpha kinase 1 [Nannochloropsis gaditana CCMP526]|uniref:eukaryotic translation initiation factor 2-alpha kinase 1 n=1 Tax=Nannochloropsis gaditana (strain CCMP526) TaxID=1093141 RepID=UPI00029F64A7|nr:eukaryotic translation initiation factor 2-alpha kinase 1 [Nannochloropsis gaditana CCMP526]EKU23191.1 eukaryotic translation initiation factor 2-alpha kinase 1 [Nannochloropsis gaditana CCMP526]|eukprot:XP_005852642.1 eukaryotic translation initiation factor 2-alpha kinase 1 [Nannochloropsis gaditana CCMP526]